MSRQYVHFSAYVEMAKQVGSRQEQDGVPAVLCVDAAKEHGDGFAYHRTSNERVWLCEALSAQYLEVMP